MVHSDTVGSRAPVVHKHALSVGQVVARVILIISVAETFIMLGASQLTFNVNPVTAAFLDGLLLLMISTGPIFFWVVRPFARAHEEASKHIEYLAYHDSLTDLPNRRMLFEHLERALAACARHRDYGAVMLLDLDGFKHINDDHGHDMGDHFLRQIADGLQSNKRKEDIVARLGGDEFVVLAQQLGTSRDEAETRARAISVKLQRATLEPVRYEAQELQVGCSIGIRLLGPRRISAAQAIREADIAMYAAKRDRNSAVRVFKETAPVVVAETESADGIRMKAG